MKVKIIITPKELRPVDGKSHKFICTEKTPFETEIEIPNEDIEDACYDQIDGNELDLDYVMDTIYDIINDNLYLRQTEFSLKYDMFHENDWEFVDGIATRKEVKAIAQKWCDKEFLDYIKDADNLVDYHCENVKFSHVDGNYVYYKIECEPFKVIDDEE